jgi:hypothetical protein
MSEPATTPREIKPQPKAYAFERSIGIPPAEACRRAGGKVENGQATKWEQNKRVQAWIGYYRSLGHTEEMLAAKRARIEQRLEMAAHGNIFDFAEIRQPSEISWDERLQAWIAYYRALNYQDNIEAIATKRAMLEQQMEMSPQIDWNKVATSPYGVIISGFKFDKDTGRLVDFERDSALQALAQLRDMHGFKAVQKTALTDPTGNNPASLYLISEKPMSEAEWEQQRTGAA